MHTKHIVIAALLAAAFAPAIARANANLAAPAVAFHAETFDSGDDDNGGPGEQHRIELRRGGGADMDLRLAGPLMRMHGKMVKNLPYSAEVISEQQQNLADGNQIVNKSSSMTYRDSAGRTRHEMRDASGVVRSVTIHDAVEGTTYVLRPDAKTATKVGSRRALAGLAGDKARARIEEMRKDGSTTREQIIVKRIERAEGEANGRVNENVRIHVARSGERHALAGLQRLEALNPMLAGAFGDMKWSGKAITKDLGVKEIEGVKANGKLRSYEIPAGEIGNRNALVVSTETWYSPELQVTLLSKRSDPRTGERNYRVAGLKRDEPPASLFTVPSDYTVKDAMAMAKKSVEEK